MSRAGLHLPGGLAPPPTVVDLKKASKTFAQHFYGSSVTGEDEIAVQVDVCDSRATLASFRKSGQGG